MKRQTEEFGQGLILLMSNMTLDEKLQISGYQDIMAKADQLLIDELTNPKPNKKRKRGKQHE